MSEFVRRFTKPVWRVCLSTNMCMTRTISQRSNEKKKQINAIECNKKEREKNDEKHGGAAPQRRNGWRLNESQNMYINQWPFKTDGAHNILLNGCADRGELTRAYANERAVANTTKHRQSAPRHICEWIHWQIQVKVVWPPSPKLSYIYIVVIYTTDRTAAYTSDTVKTIVHRAVTELPGLPLAFGAALSHLAGGCMGKKVSRNNIL